MWLCNVLLPTKMLLPRLQTEGNSAAPTHSYLSSKASSAGHCYRTNPPGRAYEKDSQTRKSWQPPRAEVANVEVQVEQAAAAAEAIKGVLVDFDTVEFQARNLQCIQGLCEQSADMQRSAGQA